MIQKSFRHSFLKQSGDMDNTSVSSSEMTTEIVENASRFTEFLSSETVAPVRKSITIIPNIVADILDVALQHKTLEIQDNQFKQKGR